MARPKRRPKKELDLYDIIKIEGKRAPDDPNDVPVATERYQFIFQREQVVPVPREIANVLRDAVIKVPVSRKDSEDGRARMRSITRFPFTVLYSDVGEEAYKELMAIGKKRVLTQADIDLAMAPPEVEAEATDG